MKTKMILIGAPSGAGKSTFLERILRENPRLVDVITYTTRAMRPNEKEGEHYHYVSREKFEQLIGQGFFVEYAKVHVNFYGTPRDQLFKAWEQGKVVIMDLDVQGIDTLRRDYPDSKTIFIYPPSIEELRRRVSLRPGGPPPDLEVRMQNAAKEMEKAKEFDFIVINDDLETAYAKFKKIIEDLLKPD
jgi:guanylate kinase